MRIFTFRMKETNTFTIPGPRHEFNHQRNSVIVPLRSPSDQVSSFYLNIPAIQQNSFKVREVYLGIPVPFKSYECVDCGCGLG